MSVQLQWKGAFGDPEFESERKGTTKEVNINSIQRILCFLHMTWTKSENKILSILIYLRYCHSAFTLYSGSELPSVQLQLLSVY